MVPVGNHDKAGMLDFPRKCALACRYHPPFRLIMMTKGERSFRIPGEGAANVCAVEELAPRRPRKIRTD